MYRNKLKLIIQFLLLITLLSVVLGLTKSTDSKGLTPLVADIKVNFKLFSQSTNELQSAIAALNENPQSLIVAKKALKNSRLAYKRIAFFLDYFFQSSSLIYNKPAKVEVEEPYMEYQQPSGFQVIEALLFDTQPTTHQKELMAQAELLASSASDLPSLLYSFTATDSQILESVRLEIIRVITLSITGYDAPELKSGIVEAEQSIRAIQKAILPLLKQAGPGSASLIQSLDRTAAYLYQNPDFDSFDRMEFLTSYALPLQEQLSGFISFSKADLNTQSALNYNAKNIFSPDAIPITVFPEAVKTNTKIAALGKKLFLEKALSGNLKRNCASCHHPNQYFSEPFKTSMAFDGKSNVSRNAPTLLYAGFQYSQFWDGRVKSLKDQIKAVITNPQEMNGSHQVIAERVSQSVTYRRDFKDLLLLSKENTVTMDAIAFALAAYVQSLAPFNSAFDRYISGDHKAMNASQLKGFNLFMGKGQCGSCHFAPLFNGLIPPYYKLTEYEILGTPENADFQHPKEDHDRGRYNFFPISYYQAAFKTPTVRNVEKTAPYMHNGVFQDLDQVVDFYNKGGGAGLGMDLPGQTLSSKPLNLNEIEKKDLVSFLKSLTDKL